MAYAVFADVQARIPVAVVTLGVASEPTSSQVTDWLASASHWIDSTLAWRYVVPVTDADDIARLEPICAALVAAQVYSVRAALDPTLDAMVKSLRAEALGGLVYHPGGVGTWLPGGSVVISGKGPNVMAKSYLDLPNTAEVSGTAVSRRSTPVSNLREPGVDGEPERWFSRS